MARFSHMRIEVSDLERSLEFYGKGLGLKTTRITDTVGSVSLETASLDLVPKERLEEFKKQRWNVTIAFSVPNLTAYHQEIKKRGVETLDEPTQRPWGSFNSYLKDGYTIEVERES